MADVRIQSDILRKTTSLRIDPHLMKTAKIYSIENDISVSELIENYMRTLKTKHSVDI